MSRTPDNPPGENMKIDIVTRENKMLTHSLSDPTPEFHSTRTADRSTVRPPVREASGGSAHGRLTLTMSRVNGEASAKTAG